MVHSANYFDLLHWIGFCPWKKNYTLQRKLHFIIYFLIKLFCIKAAEFNVSCAPHIYHIYRVIWNDCRDLTTCHTQYTWDSSIRIFLFNRTTLQVFVTYLIGALYVHPLWFYKQQHDNRVRSKLSVACQRWWFQWRFWFVPSVLGYLREEEKHKPDPWRSPIDRNHMGLHLENEVARRVASGHHRLMFAESQRVHI